MSSCSRTSTKAPRSKRRRRNSGFSFPSAEIVPDLDDDVLIQILSYLPVKSLLRLKRVSKRWFSIITNPDFSNRYIESNHPFPISGFFVNCFNSKYNFVSLYNDETNRKESIPPSLPLRFTDHPADMVIMQSTNGLFLCKCSCSNRQFNTNYYVYNPTTKQSTLLPRIAGGDNNNIALSLAFDPSKSPYYKVICLKGSVSSDSILYHVEVYTSSEGPWRRIFSVSPFALPPTAISLSQTVFWNGAVHWFDYRSRDCLSFDIDREEIKILSLPFSEFQGDENEEDPPDIGSLRFLDESRGNLYSIEVNDTSSSSFPVYEMESGGSSWSLKYNIDLEPLGASFPEMMRTEQYTDRRIYVFSMIGFVKGETDLESYVLLHVPNKAVKYNFVDKSFEILCGFEAFFEDGIEYGFRFQTSFKYVESLANV